MGNENTEYKCAACKKIIKSHVVSCKQCTGAYFHPGCMTKHRSPNANKENVTCKGQYDMFSADEDEESREAISMEEPNDVLSMAMLKTVIDVNESMKKQMKEMTKSIEKNNENNKRTKKMVEEMRDQMKEMNKKMDKMISKDEVEGMINKP